MCVCVILVVLLVPACVLGFGTCLKTAPKSKRDGSEFEGTPSKGIEISAKCKEFEGTGKESKAKRNNSNITCLTKIEGYQ